MKYALCVESIFGNLSHAEQIARTLESNYSAVEVWSVDEQRKKILLDARAKGIQTAMIVGVAHFGTRDKRIVTEKLDALRQSLEVARELECPNICLFAGDRFPNTPDDEGRAAVIDFLGKAAEILAGSGAVGIVESLSPGAHPHALIRTMKDAASVVREINRPEIRLQFDIFHTAITDPDVRSLVRENLAYTAYYQAADAPGRGQPGTGTLDLPGILGDIKKSGFDGYFCWEFAPQGDAMKAVLQAKAIEV